MTGYNDPINYNVSINYNGQIAAFSTDQGAGAGRRKSYKTLDEYVKIGEQIANQNEKTLPKKIAKKPKPETVTALSDLGKLLPELQSSKIPEVSSTLMELAEIELREIALRDEEDEEIMMLMMLAA